jgi:hypothetical protein
MMTTFRRITICLAVLAIASPVAAQVRDFNSAAEKYGRGVHAYFAGRSAEAESLLSAALAENASDPRFWYFRSMARLRLGRSNEARADMAAGAALEARQPGRFAVGSALVRVQGADRLLLEGFREQARTKAARNVRPPLDRSDEAAVLRNRVVVPLDELLRQGGPRSLSAEEISRRGAAIKAMQAPAMPAAESALPSTEPLDAAHAAPPAAEAEAVLPPQSRAASEPSELAETEPTEEDAPPAEEPAANEPAASDEDPFGDLTNE